jgi:hypothetical protein
MPGCGIMRITLYGSVSRSLQQNDRRNHRNNDHYNCPGQPSAPVCPLSRVLEFVIPCGSLGGPSCLLFLSGFLRLRHVLPLFPGRCGARPIRYSSFGVHRKFQRVSKQEVPIPLSNAQFASKYGEVRHRCQMSQKRVGYCWRTPFKVLGVLFPGKFPQLFCLQRRHVGHINFGTFEFANSIGWVCETAKAVFPPFASTVAHPADHPLSV